MARGKVAALVPRRSVSIKIRGDMAESLSRFEAAVKEEALKSAAWAGATVMYDEMRARAPTKSGGLRDSIYRWRDRRKQSNDRVVYAIGPNKAKAPHWHLIEYGHYLINVVIKNATTGELQGLKTRRLHKTFVPPVPYIRPTFDAKIRDAIAAMRKRLGERVRELARKQAKP